MQTQQQITVPFDRLIRDETANVRNTYSEEAIEEMKASILAHGVIQPIAVRPPETGDADLGGQLYRIFAGGRRWVAMGDLVKEGKLSADYPVPIIVREVGDTEATELSLAENLVREQMTPADAFRAFSKLADAGQSVESIALHFGQTDRYVKGRMALAKLHPDILAAFEQGDISFASACAYTLNPDQNVQFRHFTDAGRYYRNESWAIKKSMKQTGIDANGPVAAFIGEEAYLAAGGIVHADLFGDDVTWISGELIETLKVEALERFRAEHLGNGWSFCSTTAELGVAAIYQLRTMSPEGSDLTEAEQARMEEISMEMEGLAEGAPDGEALSAEYDALEERSATFTPEQMRRGGVVIDLETMQIRFGCLRPGATVGSGSASEDEPLATAAKAQRDPLALTQPLKDQVGEAASDALAVAVLRNPHMALALVTAMLANADDYSYGAGRPTRIKVERLEYAARETKAGSIRKSFDALVKLETDELLERFAGFAAQTVDLTEKWFSKDGPVDDKRRDAFRLEYLSAFAADPLAEFDPEAWFLACTKPMIEAGAKEMGIMVAGKKSDMAREATAKAKELGWLPKPLRLAGYTLKGQKPAGEKKAAKKLAANRKKKEDA